jgi:hypothetical protein
MNTTEQTFTEQWQFESEAKTQYPGYAISYSNPRKSAAGAPLYDWTAIDGEVTATHTMMVLKSRKNGGKPYAVVTREPTPAPPSAELAAILKTAFA